MTQRAEAVLEQALSLAEGDRVELAEALLESLGADMEPTVEASWRQEVALRVRLAAEKATPSLPWPELRERLVARMNERRSG